MNETELLKPEFYYKIDDELELRLPKPEDAESGYALIMENFQYLSKWGAWVKDGFSLADVQSFIARNLQQYTENKQFTVRIIFRNQMAGNIGYNKIDWANRTTEIGYWIGESFQGHGLVTRACRVLITHAFRELKLNRVEICCAVENAKSRLIPEKLGFKQEGILRDGEWVHDHFNDIAMYSMLASEWQDKS